MLSGRFHGVWVLVLVYRLIDNEIQNCHVGIVDFMVLKHAGSDIPHPHSVAGPTWAELRLYLGAYGICGRATSVRYWL